MFLVTVSIYQWTHGQDVQQLEIVGAYDYAWFKIHFRHMNCNLSLSFVCHLPCAATRNDPAKSRIFVILLDVRLRSDSGREMVYGRKIRLRSTSEVLLLLVLVKVRHYRGHT